MADVYCLRRNPVVRRTFLTMLAPTILMNLTTAIGSMADSVIIGNYLDDLSLSVVTFATPIYMVINTLASLFAVGGCIAMSIDAGKGDKKASNQAFSISMEFLAITGIIMFLMGMFFSGIVTRWLGAGEEVFEQVRIYSQIVMMGGPVFVLNVGVAFFVRNDGRPTLAMAGMFLSIIVDIIFNVVFVGYMNLGVAGAAYSTVLGQLVSVIVISGHFFSSKNTLKFYFTLNSTIFRIIKNGISTALHFIYQFLSILILNHYVVSLAGTDGVVIYTVVFNLYTVSLALFEGLSQTIQPMISVYYGEKSYRKIKETIKLAFVATLIICGTVTLLLEIFPRIVPWVFGLNDSALITHSAQAVRIYATSMIIMTINVILGYYLQSVEINSMAAWLVSLRCCILFLGCTFILGKLYGMNGVWAAYTFAEVLAFLIYIIMNCIKRYNLKDKGVLTDLFFLDKSVESGTHTFVFERNKNEFNDFKDNVCHYVGECFFDVSLTENICKYLDFLNNIISVRKREYIEVEVNQSDKKVIIRDNYNHNSYKEGFFGEIPDLNEDEYGPVLGWNRVCLK